MAGGVLIVPPTLADQSLADALQDLRALFGTKRAEVLEALGVEVPGALSRGLATGERRGDLVLLPQPRWEPCGRTRGATSSP
jgi:hypothetical protein